jgi:phosphoenolpyruvate synthase/pyruvate phosphate dikinase
VLAVSPQGVVQLSEYGPRWDKIFGTSQPQDEVVIRPDLEKLDIKHPSMVPLARLRASDSGRLSGPKGANLGELKHYFGDAVPDGFVINFGVFRMVLEQPIEAGGPSVWNWMKQQYQAIDRLQGERKERAVSAFLARLRRWIANCDPGKGFRQGLRMGLDRLGPDGSFGVFVRSDTNVEDLPGFTGAGLNLTVFNVVGYENVLGAVKEVWASPFTERAYGWRQSHMEQPEYVFPAVVVQKSFPSEKSGVLVTVDVDTGERGWLSVAVSEGVGGAVEGQAAESLLINANTGEVRFLAQATAPLRMELSPTGGIVKVPASGTERVLQPAEIEKLVAFARTVGDRFPALQAEDGTHLPADVEFAFRGGRLTLLQIRPFVESRGAQQSAYLSQLDAAFRQRGAARVDLKAVPREPKR